MASPDTTPHTLHFPLLPPHSERDASPSFRTDSRAVYTPYLGASAEISSFPHFASCVHCAAPLGPAEARWGTGLCDACYGRCERACQLCSGELALQQLHWMSGLCDGCYDTRAKQCAACDARLSFARLRRRSPRCEACADERRPAAEPRAAKGVGAAFGGFEAGVKVAIGSQFIFYLAPGIMVPSLYVEIQAARALSPAAAASSYSFVLMTCTAVAMAAPVPLGLWAEARGEREVYAGVTLIATFAALSLAYASDVYLFALSWGLLSAPLALRGVRYAYFARSVRPDDLSAAGMLASAAGLLGSLVGPVLAAVAKNSFFCAALTASLAHAVCAVALAAWLPEKSRGGRRADEAAEALEQACDKCGAGLAEHEKVYGTSLCNECYDNWFRHFKRRVLFCFCGVAGLLELSMNMGVVAAFQPLAVEQFGWGTEQIAAVNFLSSAASIVVSVSLAHLRLPEFEQSAAAAALYFLSVLCFSFPPLAEWRLVVGLVLGLKAQILFMAPFTAAFSRLIGGSRVTNALTTVLCIAPMIGAAIGTALSPVVLPSAGSFVFLGCCCAPCLVAALVMLCGWRALRRRDINGNAIGPAR
ncbi:hypothetical protein AB1Y20_010982 [Prymnesium parvum]|uniref:Major facilitator superfamily (MFS) profile domain-containing protein n=1 Tax=Prymnesium parvum TaxID=97485 RepID=A0AB34ILY8_PRYPA